MRNRFRQLRRSERGMAFVFVGLGFMAFMAATTLAIDVGMFMTARSQAQNSADAGALAGAVALVFNDFDDRSPGGPAVQSAMNTALANKVMSQNVSVLWSDVTFPLGPTGLNNRVRVDVFRNTGRANPVPTMIGSIFGVNTVDIRATATAEASPANAATCVLPFTIPDRWNERTDAPWTADSEFNMYDQQGNLLSPGDLYVPGVNGTGYNAERDKGLLLRLKANNDNKTAPSFYNPWSIPGSLGASDYRDNIAGCNQTVVETDFLMTAEPGNMVGPTMQGMDILIAKDPGAWWDDTCNCVMDSAFPISPRITTIPLYDPVYYEEGKHNGRNADLKVASYLGFFIERMVGNEVWGYVTPITALRTGNSTTTSAFAMAIRLVE